MYKKASITFNTTAMEIEPEINPDIPGMPPAGKEFIRGINARRSFYLQQYGMSDSEFASMAALAANLAQHETAMGRSYRYRVKQLLPDWVIGAIKFFCGRKIDSPSRGFTQIKYKDDLTIPELCQMYKVFDITDDNIQHDPRKMADATLARLYYNKSRMNSVYHWSDGEEIPDDVAQYLYWNAGKLTDGKNPNMNDPETSGYSGRARRFNKAKIIRTI